MPIKNDGTGGMAAAGASTQVMDRIVRLGMSPRQQELNRLWSWFRCVQYDARKLDWDGRERLDPIDHEAVASQGFLPPGFYDAGGQMFPLKFRRPTAPYHLVKVVVERFTGLLFSERCHPVIRVEGDDDTEDFVHALAESARLWQKMIMARTFGGSMGTVAVGFQFVDGKPCVEVHDPRYLFPEFIDRETLALRQVEKRYTYPEHVRNRDTGKWEEVWYWYRRVIDQQSDTLWKPLEVGDGEEPDWADPNNVERHVEHGLGFCPVLWVQNLPVTDDIDGDPDCQGIYDMAESIDALLSQASTGTLKNSDPTVHISTDLPMAELRKGSDNAIKTEKGGSMSYVELSGTGPAAGREMAEQLRKYALEVAQCVLEHPDMANRTATEIERAYSSMLAKTDILREQYGEKCVKPLLEMMVEAARSLGTPRRDEDGNISRQVLDLPPRVMRSSNGQGNGRSQQVARKLGPGGVLGLKWPRYFEPTTADISQSTDAAGKAKAFGLIDDEHAANFVAELYDVEDVPGMLDKAKRERTQQQSEMEQMMLGQMGAGSPMASAMQSPETGVQPEPVKFFQYEIEGGLVTINEVRESKGLGPIEDGDMTLPQYKVKYAHVYASQTAVETSGTAAAILGIEPAGVGGM